jgi:hypothetical protein
MASAESISRRRTLADNHLERLLGGLSRVSRVPLPPRNPRHLPDAEHRAAETEERTVAFLRELLLRADPDAPEAAAPPPGIVTEYRATEDPMANVENSHSGEEARPAGRSTFKELKFDPDGAPTATVRPAADIPATLPEAPEDGDRNAYRETRFPTAPVGTVPADGPRGPAGPGVVGGPAGPDAGPAGNTETGGGGAGDEPTFGDDKIPLSQLDGKTDEELDALPGVGPATVKEIHAARTARDRAAARS